MGDVTPFKPEMQPARPFPREPHPIKEIVLTPFAIASMEAALPTDPRDPPVQERVTPLYASPSEDDWELLAAHEGLFALIQKYGAQRVMTWVRSLATIAGQEVK